MFPVFTLPLPPLIFEFNKFQITKNFGNLGGKTDIALLNVLYFDKNKESLQKTNKYSAYTIHATPQNTHDDQQHLLLRDRILERANNNGNPPESNQIHLTSGCINHTSNTFNIIKKL